MSPALRVVLDTDFLSAFLKIDRLSLVKDFYGVEELLVPPAVYREVSVTDLFPGLAAIPWIRVQLLDAKRKQQLRQDGELARLGPGEQEAACKISGLTSRDEIFSLISALEERDRYGFRKDVRDLLLS